MWNDLVYRLRALVHRRRLNAELDEELRDHMDREAEKYMRAGASPAEARRRAHLAMGGLEQTRQRTREAWGTRLVEQFGQDMRYGLRSLGRNRMFTAVFVLTLSLGIGSCTAIFSLMKVVMFPPLPYGHIGQLVYLTTPNRNLKLVPPDAIVPDNADLADIRRDSHAFTSITQFGQRILKVDGTSISLGGATVDGGFFTTLQDKPAYGRSIGSRDNQQNAAVAVISDAVAHALFGSSPAALDKTLHLNGATYRVIGVMAPGFHFPHRTDVVFGNKHIAETDVWIPLALTPEQRADRGMSSDNYALARLAPDISAAQAANQASSLMQQLGQLHTTFGFKTGWYVYVRPFTQVLEGSARPVLSMLMAAVSFVLLIACGNAVNLLLARSANRMHELGMRATLGAGRARLTRQMLTESLLLGVGSGLAGVGLAYVFLHLLLLLDPGDIPRLDQASISGTALSFAVALTLLTSTAAGTLPALLASRIDLIAFLRGGGQKGARGSRSRLRGALILGEVAIVMVLLTGAGLLLHSLLNLNRVSLGFSSETLSMKLDLPDSYDSVAQKQAFYRTLLAQLMAVPGVSADGATGAVPLGDTKSLGLFRVQGADASGDQAFDNISATAGYWSAMRIRVLHGRVFTEEDAKGPIRTAVVSQAFARRYFPGRSAVGRHIIPITPGGTPLTQRELTIVGVVGDVRDLSVEAKPSPQMYAPFQGDNSTYIVLRSALPRAETMRAATAILHRLDRGLAFTQIHTMGELESEAIARQRFQTVLLTVFAGMAFALSMIGLYGLLAYSVLQREAEMGIRLALGATRGNIVRLILGEGVRLVVAGLALGTVAALLLTRFVAASLYHVRALDPATFLAAPVLLLVVALAACFIPAKRASAANPASALRRE